MAAIEAVRVWKSFGQTQAVRDLHLRVQAGEIYGLVGPDGAGKTTAMRLLCGAMLPDPPAQGGEPPEIRICGQDVLRQPEAARASIGYLAQRFSLYEDLTVLENIRFFAELRGLRAAEWRPRCMEILEFVGLEPFTGRRAGQLSGGMKQKLGLAAALVHRPRLLLLDEPTTGVDPVTRQDFWQLIIRLTAGPAGEVSPSEERVAVLVSTPYMDEAARCARVGFLQGGRLLLESTPAELRTRLEGRMIELRGSPILHFRRQAEMDPGVEDVQMFGDRLHLRARPGETQAVLSRLEQSLRGEGGGRPLLRSIPPQLEDVFISLLVETGSKEAPPRRSGQEV